MKPTEKPKANSAIRDHRRQWRDCLYVYPVISRRSEGLSIGVNLNPNKRCNFACLYCQVDRPVARCLSEVKIEILENELRDAMDEAISGRLWQEQRFASTSPDMRRINDIAFSGDGEPVCLKDFDKAVAVAAKVKRDLKADDIKIVLISNASMFASQQFQRALPILDANNGEIWAKLDAGSEEYFKKVNRPAGKITLEKVLENITAVAKQREIVIQTLFFKIDEKSPAASEIDAYCQRLREIVSNGGKIKLIQLHTIARSPLEAVASTIPDNELDELAEKIRSGIGNIPLRTYYGADAPPQKF